MKKDDIIIGTAVLAFAVVGYFVFQYGKKLKAITEGTQRPSNPIDSFGAMAVKAGLDTARDQYGLKF